MSLNRSFMLLKYPETHLNNPSDPNDYFRFPTAAAKVVQSFNAMGVKYFLPIPGTFSRLDEYRIIGRAIEAAGLQFFTYEGYAWEDSIVTTGRFDANHYLQNWVRPVLIPLKQEFPVTFTGFHLKDEPGLAQFDDLASSKACLNSQPEFQGMKFFLNLRPIASNYEGLSGLAPKLAGLLSPTPKDIGVDCENEVVVDQVRARELAAGYGIYARQATEKIRPDYLAFDHYPFQFYFARCVAARELTVSENLSIISLMGQLANITPIAYLQNVQFANDFYATFHHLRWFASWAFAFGVRGFANFVSHSGLNKEGQWDLGLLDAQNNETKLASDQLSLFGYIRFIQVALEPFSFNRFVAPFLAVMSGDVVGWLPSPDVIAGEYWSASHNQALVFFARRGIEGAIHVPQIGLTAWYTTIEEFDIPTGQWTVVSRSSNAIQLTLSIFPGALYRLTR